MKKRSPAIKVRGECPAGHVVETTAARGRLTWSGTCPTEGCEHKVVARRVRSEPAEAPVVEAALPSGAKVKRVTRYVEPSGPEPVVEPQLDNGRGAGVAPTATASPEPAAGAGERRTRQRGRPKPAVRGPVESPQRRELVELYPGVY